MDGEKKEAIPEKKRPVSPINGQPVPNGRPKGVPNKSNIYARAAIAEFVEGNVDRLTHWLDLIAEKDPAAAFRCFMDVVEYHIPKLARSEITGKDGGAVQHEHTIKDILKTIDGKTSGLPSERYPDTIERD